MHAAGIENEDSGQSEHGNAREASTHPHGAFDGAASAHHVAIPAHADEFTRRHGTPNLVRPHPQGMQVDSAQDLRRGVRRGIHTATLTERLSAAGAQSGIWGAIRKLAGCGGVGNRITTQAECADSGRHRVEDVVLPELCHRCVTEAHGTGTATDVTEQEADAGPR